MRKNRLLHLVLAATFLGAVSALSFLPQDVGTAPEEPAVEWVNADETNPISPPASPSPSYDGDGTSDPDDGSGEGDGNGYGDGNGEGNGGDGSEPSGGGDAGEPEVDEPGREARDDDGGMLGLSFPAQAGLSVGLIALAFLALLPGRRMPEHLR